MIPERSRTCSLLQQEFHLEKVELHAFSPMERIINCWNFIGPLISLEIFTWTQLVGAFSETSISVMTMHLIKILLTMFVHLRNSKCCLDFRSIHQGRNCQWVFTHEVLKTLDEVRGKVWRVIWRCTTRECCWIRSAWFGRRWLTLFFCEFEGFLSILNPTF